MTWVKEKEPGVKTTATGSDLYSARNLVHTHKQLMSEVSTMYFVLGNILPLN